METTLALTWSGAVLLLAALAAPVVGWLFPDWPDRGVSLAPAAAFAVLTVTAYWLGQFRFGPYVVPVGVLVLSVLAALALRGGASFPTRRALAPLAVFSVSFAVVLLVRAIDPGIGPYAGEQFLDFGLIHAVQRTTILPPEDIWFAGRRLRYYFGGPLLSALLSWLTGTAPRYAYNLLLPTVFATLATAAYGVAGAIAADRDLPVRGAGVLGAGLVAFAGPLSTAARGLTSYLPDDLVAEYGRVLFVAIPGGTTAERVDSIGFLDGSPFDYWLGRYVIPDTPTVFPSWTYVNGDLRPHMYAGPILLLGVALAFAYYRTPDDRRRRRRVLLFGALPVVGGLLTVTNTFDLPALLGVAWLALVFADSDPRSVLPDPVTGRLVPDGGTVDRPHTGAGDGRSGDPGGGHAPHSRSVLRAELRRAGAAAAVAGIVGVVACLWAGPYLLHHTAQNEGLRLFGPTSNLGGLLLVWGGFLLAFALAYLPPSVDGWSRSRRVGLAVGLPVVVAAATLAGNPAVGLFVPLVLGGWWLHRSGRCCGFDVVLAVAGGGLVLFPELAYVAVWPYDPNAPRWNTVYKIAMQAWTLWGVAAAVALGRVLSGVASARSRATGAVAALPRPDRQTALAVVAVCLLVAVAVFPAAAFGSRLKPMLTDDSALSLNGTGYVSELQAPDQMDAVRWLRTETTGQPTMVSRPTDDAVYSWDEGANLAATFSGVPTLAGWRHAAGYHGLDRYEARVNHTRVIYQGEWRAARFSIRYFDVEYIYVGPSERDAYGTRDFAALSPAITVAYANPNVTIYHVDQTALDDR